MSVVIYASNAADRNSRGMKGAAVLGATIAEALGVGANVVGSSAPLI